MKVKKIAGILLAILLALLLALICVFFFWLGPTVKLVAQKMGSKAMGTPLAIEQLSINPRKGTLRLTGFTLANQEMFGRTNAVSLASLDLDMDVGSVFSPTVVVHRVSINSPHFVYEQNAATDNVKEFIRNIEAFVGMDPESPTETPKEKEGSKTPKVVIVQKLEINDVQVHVANTDAPQLDIDFRLDQLALSMTNGTVRLKKIRVGNPGRLETPNLFTLDEIAILLDPASIHSGRISILDVQAKRPYAYLEKNLETDTVAEFRKIADSFVGPSTDTNSGPPEAEKDPASTAPPFELHNLLVDDIQIKLLDATQTNAPATPRMLASIGSISVRLVDGKIQIKGITVPNPGGFSSTNLFQLAEIGISIAPESLFANQMVIEEILVDSPEINLEQTETSSNVADLQFTLMGFVPPAPAAPPATVEKPKPIPLADQPVVLHSLLVTNLAINLTVPASANKPSLLSRLNPMDYIRKETTEVAGTTADDGPLNLLSFDLLSLRPLDGILTISNLEVANSRGFSNRHLVTMDQLRIELDPDTLQSDTLLIRYILIDQPSIAYERQIATDNIQALQAEIAAAIARRKEDGEQVPAVAPGQETERQKVIIEHLLVQGGRIGAKISALPTTSVQLPNIERFDMGKDQGGTSLGNALSTIGTAIYDAIIESVASATGVATDALKGAGTFTLDTLGSMAGGITGKAGQMMGMETKPADPEQPEKKRRSILKRRRPGRPF